MLPILYISIIFAVIGQLLIKKGMNKVGRINLTIKNLHYDLVKIFSNKNVIIGVSFFGLSTLFWLIVLSKFDLSYAYPMVSISYVLIALFSKLFFKENVTKLRWLSVLIICFGVILVTYS